LEGEGSLVRLYEYQGKRLLSGEGVGTPRGEVCRSAREAGDAAEKLGGKVVLKPQVLAGRRGKLGVIRFVEGSEEAEKAATELFETKVYGFPVRELLVEEYVSFRRSFYASVFSYQGERKPMCIVSSAGGIDIEEIVSRHPQQLVKQPINILEGLRGYQARNLVRKLPEASSREIVLIGGVLERLYKVYRKYDCKLVEVNPLIISEEGKAVALDARIELDDDAVPRHPELGLRVTEEAGRPETKLESIARTIDMEDPRGILHFVQADPDGSYSKRLNLVPIGFSSTGTGSTLTAMDELVRRGYMPVNTTDTALVPASKIYKLTKVILSQPHIQGYVFVTPHSSQQLLLYARGMVKALKELYPKTGGKPNIPMVFCFRGGWDREAVELLRKHGIMESPLVKVLWRATEAETAEAFHELYKRWRQGAR